MHLHPEIYSRSLALVKIQNRIFSIKQSSFCSYDIKNKFSDPQNPHVAIFRYQIAPEMELRHYFQRSGAKSSSSGQKFKLR